MVSLNPVLIRVFKQKMVFSRIIEDTFDPLARVHGVTHDVFGRRKDLEAESMGGVYSLLVELLNLVVISPDDILSADHG